MAPLYGVLEYLGRTFKEKEVPTYKLKSKILIFFFVYLVFQFHRPIIEHVFGFRKGIQVRLDV